MLRLNILLLLAAALCALGVVTSQHKARKLFQELEAEGERARLLEVEWTNLNIELATWATHPRIEKIAKEKLKMRTPDPAKVLSAGPAKEGERR